MDLTDIFRTFHPKAAEYTFFSSAHGTFSNRSHTTSQIIPQQVQKDWDHTMHVFYPQHYETGSQLQEKFWKDQKYVVVKEHPAKEWMGHPEN